MNNPFKRQYWPLKSQQQFIQQLGFLAKANIPLLDCLDNLHSQAETVAKKTFYHQLKTNVAEGITLADSLEIVSPKIDRTVIAIIHIGELSGRLAENLSYLGTELGKKKALRGKVIGLLAYPFVIILVTIIIVIFLVWYILPKIIPVLTSLHTELPPSTRILLWFQNNISTHTLILITLIIILFFGYRLAIKRYPKFKLTISQISLRLPIIGKIKQYYILATISRTTSLLLDTGSNMFTALTILHQTISEPAYQKNLEASLIKIANGETWHEQIKLEPKLFPTNFTQLVRIGESTGDLSGNLRHLAELYEQELDGMTKIISSLIEPAMMIVIGLIVGFITVAIISPIYAITQNIGH